MSKPAKDIQKKPQGSQVVAVYMPRHEFEPAKPSTKSAAQPVASSFKNAFIQTLEGKGRGLLTTHLYHEPVNDSAPQSTQQGPTQHSPAQHSSAQHSPAHNSYEALHQRFETLLYGGQAWDAFVREQGPYQGMDSELVAIDAAISEGLLDHLPQDSLRLIEYGTGGKNGVRKPAHLIKAILQKHPEQIYSYVAVDILNRFATESALEIHEEFNLRSFAVVGDFNRREKLAMPKSPESVPVIISFGGGFANAQDNSPDKGPDAKENAAHFFSQMNTQHGIGSHLLMSYHCERDQNVLMREYQPTEALESFILSSFVRAIAEGVIIDKTYDPFRHWQVRPAYDADSKAVVEYAVCQAGHQLETTEGIFTFMKNDRLPITLSHKWDMHDYREILNRSGYEVVGNKPWQGDNKSRGIILAKAVQHPVMAP